MTEVRVATYNVCGFDPLGKHKDTYYFAGIDRQNLLPGIIKALRADVLLLQNLHCEEAHHASLGLRNLAEETDMQSDSKNGAVAAKGDQNTAASGVMWSSRFKPEAWQQRPHFWHPLLTVTGAIAGKRVTFASAQAIWLQELPYAGGDIRVPEAMRTAALAQQHGEIIVGMSSSSLSSAKGKDGAFIDGDPLPAEARNALTAQEREFITERRASVALARGGLVDVAAHLAVTLGATPQPTMVYNADNTETYRLDHFYATPDLAATAQSVEVVRTEQTCLASEHYPVVATYEWS